MAMTIDRDSLRLFGIDLAAVPGFLRDGWGEALRWRAFRWLTPDDLVRVIDAEGRESIRLGMSSTPVSSSGKVRFTAIELPQEHVLRRSLVLPRLSDDEVSQAVELDVRAASPFPEGDVAWGYTVERGERLRVDIALTSKPLIEAQLAARRTQIGDASAEVWVRGEPPILMVGYGEPVRQARARRVRLALFGLLAVTALLIGALAVTPTMQLRAQALEATRKNDELVRVVKPQSQMRDELAKLSDQIRTLTKGAEQRHDTVALIDEVTRQLPDDAVLNRLEVTAGTVRLAGQADNASQLLQKLGANPAFRDVKAPSGIVRAPAGSREGFTIEFRIGAEGKQP